MQKKIQQITGLTGSAVASEPVGARSEREQESKSRKRMRSPFRRFRERSSSRDRQASADRKEAEGTAGHVPGVSDKGAAPTIGTIQKGSSTTTTRPFEWLYPRMMRKKRRKTI